MALVPVSVLPATARSGIAINAAAPVAHSGAGVAQSRGKIASLAVRLPGGRSVAERRVRPDRDRAPLTAEH
jgi:hypothetical protein